MIAGSFRLIAAAALLLVPGTCLAGAAGERWSREVAQFVRAYMGAIDSGDVKSQMALVSRDPGVTSTVMGETWRGWDAIRAQSEAYVPISRKIRNVIDGIETLRLGPSAALAVVPFHSARRDTADHAIPEFEQSLTLVLQRTSAGWRMVHEHVSVKIPPPRTAGP